MQGLRPGAAWRVEWPCQVIDQECVVVVGSQGWEFAPVEEA